MLNDKKKRKTICFMRQYTLCRRNVIRWMSFNWTECDLAQLLLEIHDLIVTLEFGLRLKLILIFLPLNLLENNYKIYHMV